MVYQSDDGHVNEMIWNSRDGVTPFVVRSEDGEHELRHKIWRGEPVAPQHVPNVGDRIFVDATIEDIVPGVARRLESYVDEDGTIDPELAQHYPKKSFHQIVTEISQDELTEHGVPPPHLVAVTLERQRALTETTSERVAEAQSKGWAPIIGGRYA